MELRTSLLLVGALMMLRGGVAAQTPAHVAEASLVLGDRLEVDSGVLGERRLVDVALPTGYESGSRRYPVLVVLDGESLLQPAAGIAHFLATVREIPEMIIVGVHNTNRMRDLTPPPLAGWDPPQTGDGGVGGADAFLTFLADELLPEIDLRYRTHPYRVLTGHSLGGLFALHVLASGSNAFGAYLTLDPSLWWNDRALVEEVVSALATGDGNVRLTSAQALGGFSAQDWSALLARSADHVGERHELEGESHGSMPIQGMRVGLRSLFTDYDPGVAPPGSEPFAHLVQHAQALGARLGFPLELRASDVVNAIEQALSARMLDDARRGLDALAALDGNHRALDRLSAELAEARSAPDQGFVPLVIDPVRPTPESARAFLGRWEGVQDHDPGVDFTWIVTIEASGDTLVATGEQIGPAGGRMGGALSVIGVTSDGALELGHPLRGVPGMEVFVARLESPGVLVGHMEIRGFQVPEGAGEGRVTFRLERRDAPEE